MADKIFYKVKRNLSTCLWKKITVRKAALSKCHRAISNKHFCVLHKIQYSPRCLMTGQINAIWVFITSKSRSREREREEKMMVAWWNQIVAKQLAAEQREIILSYLHRPDLEASKWVYIPR